MGFTTINQLIAELQEVSESGFGDKPIYVGLWYCDDNGHHRTLAAHQSSLQLTCNGDGSEWHIIDTKGELK